MGFSCGIVGLPNAGKSTLFNALGTGTEARTAGFAFCTVEPNFGKVAVPDPRLEVLGHLSASKKIVPTRLEIVDIAGLVRGAHAGEGLGNRFLAQIRETDLILHVLRCFGGDTPHTEGRIAPVEDAELVDTELALADLDSLTRQEHSAIKKARGGDDEARARLEAIALARPALEAGKPARSLVVPDSLTEAWKSLQLLTAIRVLYVANTDDDTDESQTHGATEAVRARALAEGAGFVAIRARVEAEIAALEEAEERSAFLEAMGMAESGLNRLVREGHDRLNLLSFFTTGPIETRAWTLPVGGCAEHAAGCIHTDMARGFIRAETIAYDDFIACGGEAKAREQGKMRAEGRDYVVQDGDVMHFRFTPPR